jgi:hypothetical protein
MAKRKSPITAEKKARWAKTMELLRERIEHHRRLADAEQRRSH